MKLELAQLAVRLAHLAVGLAHPAVGLAQPAVRLAQPAVRAFKVIGGWPSWLYAWPSRLYGGVGWVAHVILVSAQGPNPSFSFFGGLFYHLGAYWVDLDLDQGLTIVGFLGF